MGKSSEKLINSKSWMNCYGFASGVTDWLHLRNSTWVEGRILIEKGKVKQAEKVIKVEFKHRFPHWQYLGIVEKVDDLPKPRKKEEIVFLRLELHGNRDFHFMVKLENGEYWHKRGGTEIVQITKKDVFNHAWYGRYDSPIFAFRKKI
jgi:hypothetical protein